MRVIVERAERSPSVTIPGNLVENALEHVDGHDASSGFDQPAGHETALPEGRAAVFISKRFRLGGEVECVVAKDTPGGYSRSRG